MTEDANRGDGPIDRIGSQASQYRLSRVLLPILEHGFQVLHSGGDDEYQRVFFCPATDISRCGDTRNCLGSSETGDEKPVIIFEITQRSLKSTEGWFHRC
jgi:hypothetical protein